jgi:uncharacterized lipoprotein
MNTVRNLILLCVALALSSCSYISRPSFLKNRDKQYLKATSIQPLRIPPGIASSTFQNYYPVSMRYYTQEMKDVSIVPPGLK